MWTRRSLLRGGIAAGASLLMPRTALATTDALTLALAGEPPQLDPTAGNDPLTEAVAYQNLFEGLIRIDQGGKVQPCLAKSWEISPDGLAYTFALQSDVRYHDGTSFDAGHVVFSLNRLTSAQSQSPLRALYAAISGVAAVDDATVRLSLREPDGKLLFNLGRGDAAMVAPESADNNRTVPIGTGPFAFMQWDAGQQIVVVRNEDYWGTHPRLNEVTIVFAPDPQPAITALLAGTIEGYPNFPDPAALAGVRGNPAVQVIEGVGPDGKRRVGVWNSGLLGMWANAPLEGCVLADIRWKDDSGAPQPAAPPAGGGD